MPIKSGMENRDEAVVYMMFSQAHVLDILDSIFRVLSENYKNIEKIQDISNFSINRRALTLKSFFLAYYWSSNVRVIHLYVTKLVLAICVLSIFLLWIRRLLSLPKYVFLGISDCFRRCLSSANLFAGIICAKRS